MHMGQQGGLQHPYPQQVVQGEHVVDVHSPIHPSDQTRQ